MEIAIEKREIIRRVVELEGKRSMRHPAALFNSGTHLSIS
jgi:hypothetical protein